MENAAHPPNGLPAPKKPSPPRRQPLMTLSNAPNMPPDSRQVKNDDEYLSQSSQMSKLASSEDSSHESRTMLSKHVPPSPNMAKRPRSVSMEIVSANSEKKPRSNGSNSTLALGISVPDDLSFVKRLPQRSVPRPPLNSDDKWVQFDPQMCEEYDEDIFGYMYDIQPNFMVDPQYLLAMPPKHNWVSNRHTLVNWMLCVHQRFQLMHETLYLAVNLVDRVMSASLREAHTNEAVLPLAEVQLMAATCLLIASKYEDIMPPSIDAFASVAKRPVDQVQEMERKVLVAVKFDLGAPCVLSFLRRVSRADRFNDENRLMAKFFADIMLFEPKLLAYLPSDIAAASLLAVKMMRLSIYREQQQLAARGASLESSEAEPRVHRLGHELLPNLERPTAWGAEFEYYTFGMTPSALKPIVTLMLRYIRQQQGRTGQDFFAKYRDPSMMNVAGLAEEWACNAYPDRSVAKPVRRNAPSGPAKAAAPCDEEMEGVSDSEVVYVKTGTRNASLVQS